MLIIAQPKSASTSLVKSLAKISGIKFKNGESRGRNYIACNGFEELQKYHTTTHARSADYLQKWAIRNDCILKDHILPTNEHIQALWGHKAIVLLRDPEHTIDNYVRMRDKYLSGHMPEKEAKELHLETFLKVDFDTFCEDIRTYHEGWRSAGIGLIIDYDQLVMCPRNTLLKCLKYLGLSTRGKIELIKARGNHGYNTYTGVGYKRAKESWKNDSDC